MYPLFENNLNICRSELNIMENRRPQSVDKSNKISIPPIFIKTNKIKPAKTPKASTVNQALEHTSDFRQF